MTKRAELLNSTVAYTLALLVTVTWHELGHAFAALALGLTPTVYPFSVAPGTRTDGQAVTTALTGPLLSLVTGLVLLGVHRRARGGGFWRLVLLWLGLLGVQTFAGYLITGLFVEAGDIGRALTLTGAPLAVGVLLFVVGWAMTYATGRYATAQLMRLTSPDEPLAPQLRDLGLFAWLLGTALGLLLSAGTFDFGPLGVAVGVFEVLGTLSAGIFLIFVRLFLRRVPADRRAPAWSLPWTGVLVLVAVAVARQVLLKSGLAL